MTLGGMKVAAKIVEADDPLSDDSARALREWGGLGD